MGVAHDSRQDPYTSVYQECGDLASASRQRSVRSVSRSELGISVAAVLISRIKKIGNYRAFQAWSHDSRSKAFKRVNLIYGSNGSGKSTLVNRSNFAGTLT